MRRYGVFIPESSALKCLTGQFLPQHRNRKEWVHHFEKSWNDPEILKSTWKRLTKMANELERLIK